MSVGYRITIFYGRIFFNGGTIAVNSIFGNSIGNLLTVFVFSQTGEGPGPVVCLGNSDAINALTVGQQVDGDGLGTETVLVVVVVPDLGAADSQVGQFIGQRAAGCIGRTTVVNTASEPGPLAGITKPNLSFGNSHAEFGSHADTINKGIMGNICATAGVCCIRGNNQFALKNGKCINRPAYIGITLLCDDNGLSILSAGNGQRAAGLHTVPATTGGRIVELNRRINGIGQSVVRYKLFANSEFHTDGTCVLTRHAVGDVKRPIPFRTGNNLRVNLLTICVQVNGNGFRTGIGCVLLITPDLLAGDIDLAKSGIEGIVTIELVGDNKAVGSIAGDILLFVIRGN